MPCRPLKSIDFNSLTTPKDVLKALDKELLNLAEIADETDFEDDGDAAQFKRNVTYIKGYFERYERLVRNAN